MGLKSTDRSQHNYSDADKALDKIHHPFMTNVLKKVGEQECTST
jgi:hypothetical protein